MSNAKNVPAKADAKGKKAKDDTDYELEGLMSEIETDLREDELKKIWQKYSGLIVVFVVALLVGVAGFQFYHQRETARHEDIARRYELAIQARQDGKADEALTQFTALGKDGGKGYSALAHLNQAALLIEKNDVDGAIAVYKAVAGDAAADPALRDLATLLRVLHSLDKEDPKTLEAALTPLANPGNAFSASAQELTALLAAKQGDSARAVKILKQINDDTNMPTSMRERAADLSKLYEAGGVPPAPSIPVPAAPVPASPAAPVSPPAARP